MIILVVVVLVIRFGRIKDIEFGEDGRDSKRTQHSIVMFPVMESKASSALERY